MQLSDPLHAAFYNVLLCLHSFYLHSSHRLDCIPLIETNFSSFFGETSDFNPSEFNEIFNVITDK